MFRLKALSIAGAVAAGLLSAPAVQANSDGGGLYRSPGFRPGFGRDFHRGPFVGGAFLGLGATGLARGVIA